MLQEQAETKGMRARRPWELFTDRSVRWQLISVMVISSAMQLCGNDSVGKNNTNLYIIHEDQCHGCRAAGSDALSASETTEG